MMNENNKSSEQGSIIDESLQGYLESIDEKDLPNLITERLELLEQSNKAVAIARKKEEVAKKKVNEVLTSADDLIRKAKKTGKNKPKVSKTFFSKREYVKPKDDLDAVKANLNDMISFGIESAEAQKKLVEVQSALTESQIAMVDAQEKNLEYEQNIAKTAKFLYGLTALNMATSKSLLINLEAKLTGASEETLGELAKQQLSSVLDQIKQQEGIVIGLNRTAERIDILDIDVGDHEKRIQKVEAENRKQNKAIGIGVKKDAEHDQAIAAGVQKDAEQDRLLKAQAKKDTEHDKAITAGRQKDAEHDRILKAQTEKDIEHDQAIEDGRLKDAEQDRRLTSDEKLVEQLTNDVKVLMAKNQKLCDLLETARKNSNREKWRRAGRRWK